MAVKVMLMLQVAVCFFAQQSGASYVIDNSKGYGRVFDGIGGLSGGGATSKLLVNYPEQQRNEILDYLFKPNFGASLHILKVEIGGDSQSTDGTESSHMHESYDLNYRRGYEWWLMTEAKKRNPDIKLYGLPWAFPGWLGKEDPYQDVEATAKYILRWLQGARDMYKLEIDYIGIWNEQSYSIPYIKTLRKVLDMAHFSNVKIVAPDGSWQISEDILKDKELAAAVHIVGAHYPGTTTTNQSLATGKALWASEDYSTFNDLVGAGCWARILNQNYVNGHMTSTISWNLIASYYSDLPDGRCGLMTANEPWSGHYDVSGPIWISAHTTQFTRPGWQYYAHGSGSGHLDQGGSYVALSGSINATQHLTLVIETMSRNNSKCIRPFLPPYHVSPQTAVFSIKGAMASIKQLYAWYTYLGHDRPQMFVQQKPVPVVNGEFTLKLGVDEVWTLSTYPGATHGTFNSSVPASNIFPASYRDNFNHYETYSEAPNFAPQIGVWEVREKTIGATSSSHDESHDKCNTQVVLDKPVLWCGGVQMDGLKPINMGGNHNWSDVYTALDVAVPSTRGADGVFLALRVDRGGCQASSARGIFLWLFVNKTEFMLTQDLAAKDVIMTGTLENMFTANRVYAVNLAVQNKVIKAALDHEPLLEYALPQGVSSKGFVAYGTSSFGYAEFDNLIITSWSTSA